MSAPLSIRLPDDLDTLIRERADQQNTSISEVIITALRRGLDQEDPIQKSIEGIRQDMQGIAERLNAPQSTRPQAVIPSPEKPKPPVTYVLEPAGWLGRLLLGRVELKPDRSNPSTRT